MWYSGRLPRSSRCREMMNVYLQLTVVILRAESVRIVVIDQLLIAVILQTVHSPSAMRSIIASLP